MLAADLLGNGVNPAVLGGLRLLEDDRDRAQPRGLVGCEAGQDRRVDAAGQEDAERGVGNKVEPQRLVEAMAQLGHRLGLGDLERRLGPGVQ